MYVETGIKGGAVVSAKVKLDLKCVLRWHQSRALMWHHSHRWHTQAALFRFSSLTRGKHEVTPLLQSRKEKEKSLKDQFEESIITAARIIWTQTCSPHVPHRTDSLHLWSPACHPLAGVQSPLTRATMCTKTRLQLVRGHCLHLRWLLIWPICSLPRHFKKMRQRKYSLPVVHHSLHLCLQGGCAVKDLAHKNTYQAFGITCYHDKNLQTSTL